MSWWCSLWWYNFFWWLFFCWILKWKVANSPSFILTYIRMVYFGTCVLSYRERWNWKILLTLTFLFCVILGSYSFLSILHQCCLLLKTLCGFLINLLMEKLQINEINDGMLFSSFMSPVLGPCSWINKPPGPVCSMSWFVQWQMGVVVLQNGGWSSQTPAGSGNSQTLHPRGLGARGP